jgi:hypothetical protein
MREGELGRDEPGETGTGQILMGIRSPVKEPWSLAWYKGKLVNSWGQMPILKRVL